MDQAFRRKTNFLISWVLVAFGQPAWSPVLAVLAAAIGYALFWQVSRRFFVGAIWFFSAQLVQLSWFSSTEYHGTYTYFVQGGIALLLGVQFGLLCRVFPKKHPTILQALGIASFWTLLEWSRLYFVCGFAWNFSGMALTATTYSTQLAALFGILGLSFWVIFTNAMFHRRTLWVLCSIFPYVFGIFYIALFEKKGEPYRVALVQTALRPEEKRPLMGHLEAFIHPEKQWENIDSLISQHEDLDLIVLPESAVPYGASRNAGHARVLAKKYSSDVIIGLEESVGENHFNSAFYFTPDGICSRYDKRVLVPLAEYLPFEVFRPLVSKYGISEFFTHGNKATLFNGKRTISPSICYDDCFGHIIREGRVAGADLLVNVTNDVWYPNSKLSRQHFDHGRIRAIENGVPLVRACNTGVTAGVDPFGRVIGAIKGEWVRGAITLSVEHKPIPTPYSLWGNWGIIIVACSCMIGNIWTLKVE